MKQSETATNKVAWSAKEWRAVVGIGSTKLFYEMNAGRVKAKKLGSKLLIITPPQEYIDSLPNRGEV